MNPGDVILTPLPQVIAGPTKLRPALLLADLPGTYQNLLLCGISTRLQFPSPNWDERIGPGDSDFASSGLHKESLIRLSYLFSVTQARVAGIIGRIDDARLHRLLARLADHLRP